MAINPDNAKRDLSFLVFFLVFLGVVWILVGKHDIIPSSPFLDQVPVGPNAPAPTSVEELKFFQGQQFDPGETSISSPETVLANNVTLYSSGAKETDAQKEYLEIQISSGVKESVNISGWILEGTSRFATQIPMAVDTFISGRVNLNKDISLNAGGRIYVVSGKSPIGNSFRLNKCMGYLTKFQVFYPSISKGCPYPEDENWPASLSYDCLDFIAKLPRCDSNFTIPGSLGGNDCIEAINRTLNYNGCVELHKNDSDFYKNIWYVYLNRSGEMWNNRHETIVLKDKNGSTIKSISY